MAKKDIDLKPTKGMIKAAQQGLDFRKEYGRGGTDVGVARARDIVNGKNLSPSTVKRMYSFFSRHGAQKVKGWKPGEEGYPSAQYIAWLLWGGDPGFSWSKRKRDELERAEKNEAITEPSAKVLFSTNLEELLTEDEIAIRVADKFNKSFSQKELRTIYSLQGEKFNRFYTEMYEHVKKDVLKASAKNAIQTIKVFEKENNIKKYKKNSVSESAHINKVSDYLETIINDKSNTELSVYLLNHKIVFAEGNNIYEALAINVLNKPVKIIL